MTDHAQRRTDEASRSQVGEPSAGSSGLVVSLLRACGTPELRSGPRRRDPMSRVDSYPERSRSWPTIQAIFCVPEMWKSHGGAPIIKAPTTPERAVLDTPAGGPPA